MRLQILTRLVTLFSPGICNMCWRGVGLFQAIAQPHVLVLESWLVQCMDRVLYVFFWALIAFNGWLWGRTERGRWLDFGGENVLPQLFSISFAFELLVFVEVLIPIMSRWFIYSRFCDNFGSFRETVALWISHIRWKTYFRLMSPLLFLLFDISVCSWEGEREREASICLTRRCEDSK